MPSQYVLSTNNREINCFTGAKMQKIINNFQPLKINTTKSSIQGIGCSRGSAQGKVVIVRHSIALEKVRRGNIMVAVTTHPEYLPAMKKCAAIITDEGGIACHAAIVYPAS
jgi:phosphoenolpyruvate synthase/pyruvate phosphate dikinase